MISKSYMHVGALADPQQLLTMLEVPICIFSGDSSMLAIMSENDHCHRAMQLSASQCDKDQDGRMVRQVSGFGGLRRHRAAEGAASDTVIEFLRQAKRTVYTRALKRVYIEDTYNWVVLVGGLGF